MLSEVTISRQEMEKITGLDITATQVSGVYRFSPLRSFSGALNAIASESILFGAIAVFIIPLVAIAVTRYANVQPFYILWLALIISAIIYGGRGIYLYLKERELRNAIALLEQIDKHNKVVQSLEVIQKISDIKNPDSWQQYSPAIIECLQANRESLLCALMMDAIARDNKLSLLQQAELLATIESNLEFIRYLSDRDGIAEYTHLINEVLTINLKVNEEMKNMNRPHFKK